MVFLYTKKYKYNDIISIIFINIIRTNTNQDYRSNKFDQDNSSNCKYL